MTRPDKWPCSVMLYIRRCVLTRNISVDASWQDKHNSLLRASLATWGVIRVNVFLTCYKIIYGFVIWSIRRSPANTALDLLPNCIWISRDIKIYHRWQKGVNGICAMKLWNYAIWISAIMENLQYLDSEIIFRIISYLNSQRPQKLFNCRPYADTLKSKQCTKQTSIVKTVAYSQERLSVGGNPKVQT